MTARPEDRKVRLILSPTLVRLATVAELFYEDLAEVVISKDINFERYPYALDPRFTVHLVQSGFKYTARLSREVGTDVLVSSTTRTAYSAAFRLCFPPTGC